MSWNKRKFIYYYIKREEEEEKKSFLFKLIIKNISFDSNEWFNSSFDSIK